MRLLPKRHPRRGVVIPMIALCLVAILGMVAIAIDIGMVAVAKNQCQNAADSSASATVRAFTGQTGYNLANAPTQGVKAAVANQILGTNVVGDATKVISTTTDVYTSGNITISCGGYYYIYNDNNPSSEGFQIIIPGKAATEPYTAVKAVITGTSPMFFGSVFGASPFNVKATSVAAFRPRDVSLIVDLSGSMRFESCIGAYADGSGNVAPYIGPRNQPMNPDSNYPTFGHYSAANASTLLYGNTSYPTLDVQANPGNVVVSALGGNPLAGDYMSSGSTQAFTAAPTTQAGTPAGDNYLKSGGNYIKTVTDLLGATPTPDTMITWCRNGYKQYNGGTAFNGYTAGPTYWGKTFFVWPPDPLGSDLDPSNTANHANNGARDWRQRFFFKKNVSTSTLYWLDHTNILFNPSGQSCTSYAATTPIINQANGTQTTVTENGQSVTYVYLINYAAVFQWLRNQAPTFFPSSMLSGRIQFYSSIPDPTGDVSFNTRFWTQNPMTNLSERFWKDYVDMMLGQVQTGAGTYANSDGTIPYTAYIGTGDMFAWGTPQITQKPDCNYTATVNSAGGYAVGYNGTITLNNVSGPVPAATAVDLPSIEPITGATSASPIVITANNHGLSTGNVINIQGVGGLGGAANNSAATPTWTVTVLTANTFSLNGSVGKGKAAYTGGGTWVPAITGATNASPIVITTGANHNMIVGSQYTVNIPAGNVTGNTAANGKWTVTATSATSFSLSGSSGNGAFVSTSGTAQWSPIYYLRFGYGSSFYEIASPTATTGTLSGTADIALQNVAVANASAVKIYTTVPQYMNYGDNPYRPLHQMWFGPQTWLDWLGNYSISTLGANNLILSPYLRWAGNTHEAQSWSCKVGVSAAITDMQNNHPNDFIGMTFFNNPSYSKAGGGFNNSSVIPLGRSYTNLQNALWFPPTTVTGTATSITPYDSDFANVPRAQGMTAPQMGFMLTYNMLSSSVTNLRTFSTPSTTYRGAAGGLGRKGAQRLVIFETDGDPNTRAYAALTGSGSDYYYPIRQYDPTDITNGKNEFPALASSYTNSEVYTVVQQICAQSTASPPGYSTTRKPALVYALGYGSLFDPANKTLSGQASSLTFLQTIQYYGNTSNNMLGTSFPTSQTIYGNASQRATQMQTAIGNIMQSSVTVSLLQ